MTESTRVDSETAPMARSDEIASARSQPLSRHDLDEFEARLKFFIDETARKRTKAVLAAMIVAVGAATAAICILSALA